MLFGLCGIGCGWLMIEVILVGVLEVGVGFEGRVFVLFMIFLIVIGL